MPSSIFNSKELTRSFPLKNWKRLSLISFLLALVMTVCWELYWRQMGYIPTLNDNRDLWVLNREKISDDPEQTVIIGASRILFGFNLFEWQKAFGKKPIQLATVGTNASYYLQDIADNTNFRGTLLLEFVPGLFFVPEGNPVKIPTENIKGLKDMTLAQRWSHYIGIPLDTNLAFLEQDDLTLKKLLERLPIPERKEVLPYPIPPFFHEIAADRQAKMTRKTETDPEFAKRIKNIWKLYFTPPPPPKGMNAETFKNIMASNMEKILHKARADVKKIQERGGKVILVLYPATGIVRELEDKFTPRQLFWDKMVSVTRPDLSVHYQDHESLNHFKCPEDSHLTREDAVLFTRGLIEIVKNHFL